MTGKGMTGKGKAEGEGEVFGPLDGMSDEELNDLLNDE